MGKESEHIDYSMLIKRALDKFDEINKTGVETNARLAVIEEKVKVICIHSEDIADIKLHITAIVNREAGANKLKSRFIATLTMAATVLMAGTAVATYFLMTATG